MAFIRSREIEGELKNRGHERGTLYVLQVLAEQQIALQKDMRLLAQSVDQMATIVQSVVTVGENMKTVLDSMKSGDDDDTGFGHNTQDIDG